MGLGQGCRVATSQLASTEGSSGPSTLEFLQMYVMGLRPIDRERGIRDISSTEGLTKSSFSSVSDFNH